MGNIVTLGLHQWCIAVLSKVGITHGVVMPYISGIIVLIGMIPLILAINRYASWLIGRKIPLDFEDLKSMSVNLKLFGR